MLCQYPCDILIAYLEVEHFTIIPFLEESSDQVRSGDEIHARLLGHANNRELLATGDCHRSVHVVDLESKLLSREFVVNVGHDLQVEVS